VHELSCNSSRMALPAATQKLFCEKVETKPKRRVPVTASNAWPTSIFVTEERSIIRWQHRVQRERPTCTERKHRSPECGWKDGVSGDSAGEKPCPTKNKTNPLDSDRPSHGKRYRNFAPFVRQTAERKAQACAQFGSSTAGKTAGQRPPPTIPHGARPTGTELTFFPRGREYL